MKIIETGTPLLDHWLRMRCRECRTDFEFQVREGEIVRGKMIGELVVIKCPVCGRMGEQDLCKRTLKPQS